MAKALDSKVYIAALEELIARLEPETLNIAGESDKALIALAKVNVMARKAKEEADRLVERSEEAKGVWMANRGDAVVEKDLNPSDVLPTLSEFLEHAEVSRRTENVLANNLSRHHSLLNLVMMTEKEVREWPNAGNRTISELCDVLRMRKLRLGMTKEEAEAAYKKP